MLCMYIRYFKTRGFQLSKYGHTSYLSRRCLTHFHEERDLRNQVEIWKFLEPFKPIMPKADETVLL